MKTIRRNTFETNSSSCHCMTICGDDKLKEYKDHKVIALSPYCINSDDGPLEIVLTDDKFIPLEEAYDKLIKWHADHKDDTSVNDRYWFKTLNEVIDQLTFEKFVEKLYDHNDDIDLGSLDQYELIDCLESALDATQVLVSGSYKDPLDTKALEKPKGIKGDMVIISTEVEC